MSLEGFARACRAHRYSIGGERPLSVGDAVDFVYGSECWYETYELYVNDFKPLRMREKLPGKSGLLKQGQPVKLLEIRNPPWGSTAARISTKSNGEVWTFLDHLKPWAEDTRPPHGMRKCTVSLRREGAEWEAEFLDGRKERFRSVGWTPVRTENGDFVWDRRWKLGAMLEEVRNARGCVLGQTFTVYFDTNGEIGEVIDGT